MKPIRHILLSLAALACVLPTSAQTARKTKTCTASDMVLIYAGGARNRNWSVDRMKDYVSYTDRDGRLHSKIVPMLTSGAAVTTSRNDVDYVVTEYGIAWLRGLTIAERVQALTKIAHPDFREWLLEEAEKNHIW